MLRSPDSRAFTLLEMLTATAITMVFMALLAAISGHVSRLIPMEVDKTQQRSGARAALNFIEKEMRQAVLSRDASSSTANSLQFLINPPKVGAPYSFHDSVFWQAPIASTTNSGDFAEVGYFVAWKNNLPCLCRFFVNPDSPNYLIYRDPDNWITSDLLNGFAPGTNFEGLFLENVIGFWMEAYASGNPTETPLTSWDSRSTKKLPARVDISLIVIGPAAAKRLTDELTTTVRQAVAAASTAQNCFSNLPQSIRSNASIVKFSVILENGQ